MAKFEIKMPKPGESITEGTIMSWSVKEGDTVQEDQVLFEISTAKVSAEVPSPVAGTISEIKVKEGETAPVGAVVAIIDMDGDDGGSKPADQKEEQEAKKNQQEKQTDNTPAKATEQPREETKPAPQEAPANERGKPADDRWYSPVVLKLAGEAGIAEQELGNIPGTGYSGRLTKNDIRQFISNKGSKAEPEGQTPATESKPQSQPQKESTSPQADKQQAPASADDIIEAMDPIRRIIADHMVMSKKVSAHVSSVIETDVTRLVHWRNEHKEAFFNREGIRLTYMPAITAACARALEEFPRVNASVDGHNMILKKHINIGIAVSLDDGNLIVPVIQDANNLNTTGLATAIDSLAAKARHNKLKAQDVEGGTFTITNLGSFKTLFGAPIINQPQVAILGVGFIEKKPAVIETPEGDVIAIRHKMYLSLSYDHRIVDGALAGQFLNRVSELLENWSE